MMRLACFLPLCLATANAAEDRRSGHDDTFPDLQLMQDDDFANP